MYPLLKFGPFEIPMYGLMIAIGIVCGLIYSYITIYKAEKISKYTARRLLLITLICGLVLWGGCALFDTIFVSIKYGKPTAGGLTWLGGFVLAIPLMIILIHYFVPIGKGRALYITSLIIPAIVLTHGFGRIGCFFAGCCYGCETDLWFGVKFPNLPNPVVPTQLIEALFEFILFGFMVLTRKKLKGHSLEIYLISYGIFRFIIEFFRGDERGSTGFFLTPAQLLDIIIIIAGILIILFYKNIIFKKLYHKCELWIEETELEAKRKIKELKLENDSNAIDNKKSN